MTDNSRQRLKTLYAELGTHTEAECAGTRCRRPLSCCAPMYCDLAMDFAREYWGVELEPTWHPTLPLMGPNGCTVPPHLRPICTAHTCEINEHGCKPGDAAWTRRYYELQDEIAGIESQLFPSRAI